MRWLTNGKVHNNNRLCLHTAVKHCVFLLPNSVRLRIKYTAAKTRKDYNNMEIIKGTATSAVIFTAASQQHGADTYALAQLQKLCDNPAFAGCKIRIMPDVHPGKVGTIGFTSTLGSSVLPNVIGIDIGCGITMAKIKGKTKDFAKLDTVIRENVPSGFSVRTKPHHNAADFDFSELCCRKHIGEIRALLSLGTLGGGNHFIETDTDGGPNTYLTVHTGSRRLGKEITEYYLNAGQKELQKQGAAIPYELTYLTGQLMAEYLHDLAAAQKFAELNRRIIISEICKGMKWKITDTVSCVHNYIDFKPPVPIIRKGAIAAAKDQPVIIPVNMRDGIILGKGLGIDEWNCSAPHGAGRIMKREDVKNNFTVPQFKKAMKGVYSSCVGKETLDEAPFAYRSSAEIRDAITDTVVIDRIITPLYNYKAGGN